MNSSKYRDDLDLLNASKDDPNQCETISNKEVAVSMTDNNETELGKVAANVTNKVQVDDGNKDEGDGGKEEEAMEGDKPAEVPDLDQQLANIMVGKTMSTCKAKKAGDIVTIIVCPDESHEFDLKACTGYFLVAAADLARKTSEGMLLLAYVDGMIDISGCLGHPKWTVSLADWDG